MEKMKKTDVKGKPLEEIAETEVTEETFEELTGGRGDDEQQ